MNSFYNGKTKALLLIMALVALLLLTACGKDGQSAADSIAVETTYITLRYPAEFEGKLTTREVVQDGISVVIFNAMIAEEDRELFRIYFNDEFMGDPAGYITLGDKEIPVCYDVCEYEDEVFKTEAMKEDYYALLDAFEAVVSSICEHPQYSADKYVPPVADSQVSLKYWTVTLPENVYWEEVESETGYRVEFYGFVQDFRVDLYSVGFGEMESDFTIGTYPVDGEEREILIRIYDVPGEDELGAEDANTVYRMLESVNAVVEAIETAG